MLPREMQCRRENDRKKEGDLESKSQSPRQAVRQKSTDRSTHGHGYLPGMIVISVLIDPQAIQTVTHSGYDLPDSVPEGSGVEGYTLYEDVSSGAPKCTQTLT